MVLITAGVLVAGLATGGPLNARMVARTLPPGIVVDFKSPAEAMKLPFRWEYVFYLDGATEPKRVLTAGEPYWSRVTDGRMWMWEKNEGFVVRRRGDTRLEFVVHRGPDGRYRRVTRIEFHKPSLPPDLMPKAFNPPA